MWYYYQHHTDKASWNHKKLDKLNLIDECNYTSDGNRHLRDNKKVNISVSFISPFPVPTVNQWDSGNNQQGHYWFFGSQQSIFIHICYGFTFERYIIVKKEWLSTNLRRFPSDATVHQWYVSSYHIQYFLFNYWRFISSLEFPGWLGLMTCDSKSA